MKLRMYLIVFSALLTLGSCDFTTKPTVVTSQINQKDLKINFGRQLFFDKRLSKDNSISCATCHQPERAFTDGKPKSLGINGNFSLRNAPSLFNLKDSPSFMHDGAVLTLEMQAIVPIQDLNEMGITIGELINKLSSIPEYGRLSKKIYNRKLDAFVITRALSVFERTLVSNDSRFDDFKKSNFKNGFSELEMNGWKLFSQDLNCISCHHLPNFTSYQISSNGISSKTSDDLGRYRITGLESDKWKFKVPSLRNTAITAPYFHNGSILNLEIVIHEYLTNKESPVYNLVNQNSLSDDQRALMAFLNTLTDHRFLKGKKSMVQVR